MKRKHETDAELTTNIDCGDADDFRDQLLEQEEFGRVIKLSGRLPKLALPQDWVGIYHKSGGIVYLNRKTRVCTWSRPYHIGQASVRKHNVPTAAIPCLHEFLALEKGQNAHKKRKPSDIQDGNIGHHTGSLDNHCDDHESYLGNHGNNANCDVNFTMGGVDLQSHMKGESDDGACGYDVGEDGSNIDDSEGDSGRNQCNPHDMDGGGYHDCNPGSSSQTNQDGNDSGGKSQNNQGGSDNGSQNNGADSGVHINQDGSDVGSQSNQRGTDVGSQSSLGDTDVDSQSKQGGTDVGGHSPVTMERDLDIGKSNLGNTESKAITSAKALEDCNNGSNSERVSDRPETSQLEMSSASEIADYLGKLWQFHHITKEQEQNLVATDTNDTPQDLILESTQILKTIPYLVQGTKPTSKGNEKVVINPAGKSPRSLLHEYCLKVLRVKPAYTTKESGAPKTPFLATVRVDGLLYGSGMAVSKKQAMTLAAQKTLEIFMPESFKKLLDIEENLKIFDSIPIEDPNVYELTTKLGLLSPNQVLNECIKRNQGVLTSEVKFDLHQGEDKQLRYTMECGKHKATGTCRSKRLGRELAAQSVLQKLHPHLKYWGSVLRIYVDEHTSQEFTKPDAPAPTTSTNASKDLLSDLKREMWKAMKKKVKTPSTTGFMTNIDI